MERYCDAPVAVMNQAVLRSTGMQSLLQSVEHQFRMHRAAYTPADNPAGKYIDDEGHDTRSQPTSLRR